MIDALDYTYLGSRVKGMSSQEIGVHLITILKNYKALQKVMYLPAGGKSEYLRSELLDAINKLVAHGSDNPEINRILSNQ